jgi:phosphoribosylglycinamide formyltransferase-1
VAVLASGAGSNLQALLDDPVVGPRVALVASDRKHAGVLDRARSRGVPTVVVERSRYGTRDEFDRALAGVLEEHAIDVVLLAGFMRVLGPAFVRSFADRILNVHPSLLPAFPGAHAPREALEWGVKVSGVTIHLVDEEVDHGPVVLQEPVPVMEGDTEETLHARIQEAEHRLFPQAARLLMAGRLKVESRRVHVLEGGDR